MDTKKQKPKLYISTRELADELGLAPITIEIWRAKGQGPRYVKIGRTVRYRRQDVDAWLTAHMVGGAA